MKTEFQRWLALALFAAGSVSFAQDQPKNPYSLAPLIVQPAPKDVHEWAISELQRLRALEKEDADKEQKSLDRDGHHWQLAYPAWNLYRDMGFCFGDKCSTITVEADGKVSLENISSEDALLASIVSMETSKRSYEKIIADKNKQLQEVCVFLTELQKELQAKLAAKKKVKPGDCRGDLVYRYHVPAK